jgi:hypothetical protein
MSDSTPAVSNTPAQWLLITDDITSPMQAATAALRFAEDLMTLLSNGQSDSLTDTSWELLSEQMRSSRMKLEAAIARITRTVQPDLLKIVAVPDPPLDPLQVHAMYQARRAAEGGAL